MTETAKAGAPAAQNSQPTPKTKRSPAPRATNAVLELIRLGIENGLIEDSNNDYDSEELTRALYRVTGMLYDGCPTIELQDFCRVICESRLDISEQKDERKALLLFEQGFFLGTRKYSFLSFDMQKDLWARFWRRKKE